MSTSPLEAPPQPEDHASERRWAFLGLGTLALVAFMAVIATRSLMHARPAVPATPADHGPLPAEVRAGVLALLEPHLDHLKLEESMEAGVREFHIKGRPKAPLAKEFHAAFRPLIANEIMPRLRPYGEVLSFEIDNLDYPPARLRPLPEGR
jgi:hypothetical protein